MSHPFTGAVYGIDVETGLVRVHDDQRTGLYSCSGEWKGGDRLDVDPHFCNWVGGPQDNTPSNKPFKSV